jgi:hypothetical protein
LFHSLACSEAAARQAADNAEEQARTEADTVEAQTRKAADAAEVDARIAGDAATLQTARNYTDASVTRYSACLISNIDHRWY